MMPGIPKMKIGLAVVSPTDQVNITANSVYVVEKLIEDRIVVRNNIGVSKSYSAYRFIEADLYFTICLYGTFNNILK